MKFHKNAGDVSNAQNKTISGLCEDCNKRQYRYLVNVTRKYTRDLLTGNAFVYPVGLT